MQRKSMDEYRDLLVKALREANWNDAAYYATEILQIDENLPWAWANRGVALSKLGHPLDAILNHDRAIALEPSPISYSNKGSAYWDMEKADEAMKWFKKAIEINPNIHHTHMNMGHLYKWDGKLKEAIESYRKSVAADPTYADGQLALALALLKDGQLKEGWEQYEWRWKTNQMVPRWLKEPQWNGENLNRKSILVYSEQGFGDVMNFARVARILAQQYPMCRIIIEARQPVRRLLETIPEVYAVINFGDDIPHVDYVIPMMTLIGMLTPTINSISSTEQEFLLRSRDVEAWGRRMSPLTEKYPGHFKVGICWAGMARVAHPDALRIDQLRSTTLDSFAPLAKIPGIVWVSLQKGPPAEQVKTPPTGMTIGDFTEDMYDFYETCCAIDNCDLVISVDTAVLHAAASIGKPTWLLSRWDGCWRWFGDRKDSPWYPTLRQFVQPAPHDWDGMMEQVAVELREFIKDKSEPELDLTLAN